MMNDKMHTQDIHSTAIIAEGAKIGPGVRIGPYAVIEDDVQIGRDTVIGAHTVIHRYTSIGERNHIHAKAVLGDSPQHLAYENQPTRLDIGDDNIIREMVTIHRSMDLEQATRIGSGCMLMANSHIGHDCQVGDQVIITNNVALGGHVEVGYKAVIGGMTGVHQFVRVGAYAMVAAFTMLRKDAMPYCMIAGSPAKHYRLNAVGLKRSGIDGDAYKAVQSEFRRLRKKQPQGQSEATAEVDYWREWLAKDSRMGVAGFL